jgi:hypothetical protein
MSFSPWLFVLGTIFEETSSAPAKIEKKTFYRLSIGIWCLMVAILTNCYNGLMITGLNSPLPGSKIESFQDLLCDRLIFDAEQDFNMTQWAESSKINWYWKQIQDYWDNNGPIINPYETKDCFRIWSPSSSSARIYRVDEKISVNDLFWQMRSFYSVDLQIIMQSTQGIIKPKLLPYSDKIMLSLLHLGHAREPQSITKIMSQEKRFPTLDELVVADELEITNCEQKSAYITNTDIIELEMDFLSRSYAGKQFYTEKNDMILWEMEGFNFEKVMNSKIPGHYRWMIDSGIYDRLEVEKVGRKNRGREALVKIKKEKERLEGVSSLEGGLITLFMLCGGLISLALMSFIFLECRVIILKMLQKFYAIIWRFLVKYSLKWAMAVEECWKTSKCFQNEKTKKNKGFQNEKKEIFK